MANAYWGDGGEDGLILSGEYYELGDALGLTFDEDDWSFYGDTYQTALSLSLSGGYDDNSAGGQDEAGYWWASYPSVYISGTNALFATANSSSVSPMTYYGIGRSDGLSIRCLAK